MTADEILIIALNFSDNETYVPIHFGHAGSWVDIIEASYENCQRPYAKSVTDPTAREWVSIPSNFGRILRLEP